MIQCRFLDKAATASEAERQGDPGSCSPWRLVTVTQVEEVKFILRILPIWFCSIIFSAIYTQMLTLFIVQGATMDTRVVGRYHIPPASISLFDFISVLCWAPIYEWVLVPMARRYSGNEYGFTGLQRMGIGLAVMTVAMVAAAVVEIERLRTARIHGLLDNPGTAVPMSIFWYVIIITFKISNPLSPRKSAHPQIEILTPLFCRQYSFKISNAPANLLTQRSKP